MDIQKIKEQVKTMVFRSSQKSVNHRNFDLSDWHPLKERFEVFHGIIEDFLEKRDTIYNDDIFESTKVGNIDVLNYVYDMCVSIQKEFDGDVTLDEIVNLDTHCSGHVDYCYKFSLRLAELEEKIRKSK